MRSKTPTSIKKRMRNLCTALICVTILLCAVLTIFKTQAILQLQTSTNEITSLNQYIASLDALRNDATVYVNSLSPEIHSQSAQRIEAISTQARALNTAFDPDAFKAMFSAVDDYIQSVLAMYNEQESAMSFASYYNKAEQIWRGVQTQTYALLNQAIGQYSAVSKRVFDDNFNSLWVIAGLIAVIALFLMYYADGMIDRVIKPVHYLTERSLRIADGIYEPVDSRQVSSCAEAAVLARAFNMMSAKIAEQVSGLKNKIDTDAQMYALEMENASMQIALSETERKLLQSMINPHFLFNCLGTISSMAYLEDADKTVAATGIISSYLRETIHAVGKEILLSEELDYIKRYIAIQRMRFGDRVKLVTECDAASEAMTVPALLLQPLVENAVLHGVGPRPSGGTIWIRATMTPSGAQIILEDDGVGMSHEKIEQLNRSLRDNPELGKSGELGIGLSSSARQLKQFFKEGATIAFSKRSGGGCVVTLFCPARSANWAEATLCGIMKEARL